MAPMGDAGIVPGEPAAPMGEGATKPMEGAAPIDVGGIPELGIVEGWLIGIPAVAGMRLAWTSGSRHG
jgi:hypothetical protein